MDVAELAESLPCTQYPGHTKEAGQHRSVILVLRSWGSRIRSSRSFLTTFQVQFKGSLGYLRSCLRNKQEEKKKPSSVVLGEDPNSLPITYVWCLITACVQFQGIWQSFLTSMGTHVWLSHMHLHTCTQEFVGTHTNKDENKHFY